MEPIIKTIKRDINDHKRLIERIDYFMWLSLLALIIIFGLETYYQNKLGEPGTTYIAGFFTWIFGIILGIVFFKNRKYRNSVKEWLKARNNIFEEELIISEEFIKYEIKDYYSMTMNWSSIVSYKEIKKAIVINCGSSQLYISKDILSEEELKSVLDLFKSKKP